MREMKIKMRSKLMSLFLFPASHTGRAIFRPSVYETTCRHHADRREYLGYHGPKALQGLLVHKPEHNGLKKSRSSKRMGEARFGFSKTTQATLTEMSLVE